MQQLFTKGIPGRHRKFKETKHGKTPNEWAPVRLKKCGKWGTGGTPDRDTPGFWNGNIPWVRSGEVDYRTITDTEEKITEAGAMSINGDFLPCGTLLIAMYGAGKTRGKAALLGVPAFINQAIAFFKPSTGNNSKWFLYWFERNYDRVRTSAKGSSQDNRSLYLLKNIAIYLPEEDEQDLIVEILESSDAMIDSLQSKTLALLRLKKSLLQNLLTGKVRVRTGGGA